MIMKKEADNSTKFTDKRNKVEVEINIPIGFDGVAIRAGETWGGTSSRLIDRGEEESGVEVSEEVWLAATVALVDLVGAAGDGNDEGKWTLAKLGIACAEAA